MATITASESKCSYIHSNSLHAALPICRAIEDIRDRTNGRQQQDTPKAVEKISVHFVKKSLHVDLLLTDNGDVCWDPDRKSTHLNSSHLVISYAVFCLKKKIKTVPQIK